MITNEPDNIYNTNDVLKIMRPHYAYQGKSLYDDDIDDDNILRTYIGKHEDINTLPPQSVISVLQKKSKIHLSTSIFRNLIPHYKDTYNLLEILALTKFSLTHIHTNSKDVLNDIIDSNIITKSFKSITYIYNLCSKYPSSHKYVLDECIKFIEKEGILFIPQ